MFSPKKQTLARLTAKSEQIFDVFTQTQKDCDLLNSEITSLVSEKIEEVNALNQEISSLNAVRTKNENLSKKISTFLNS